VPLRRRLAEALTNAGHSHQAAEMYQRAARDVDGLEAVILLQRAAEQLLQGGYVNEGIALTKAVSRSVGLRMVRNPVLIVAALIVMQLRIMRLPLPGPGPIEEPPLTRASLQKGLLLALSRGTLLADWLRGIYFLKRTLLLGLKTRDVHYVGHLVACEAIFAALRGKRERSMARRLEAMRAFARSSESPYFVALCEAAEGYLAFSRGHWAPAREWLDRAERRMLDRCTGVAWELNVIRIARYWSLYYMGDAATFAREVRALQRDSEQRGNLFTAGITKGWIYNTAWLIDDEPDESARMQAEMAEVTTASGFDARVYLVFAEAQRLLYLGDGAGAWRHLRRHQAVMRAMISCAVAVFGLELCHLRARVTLAAVASGAAPKSILRTVRREARALARSPAPWGAPLAGLVEAGIAGAEGGESKVISSLSDAIHHLRGAGLAMHAAAAERRLGERLGGEEGTRRISEADQWMTDHGIRSPVRMAWLLAPGFPPDATVR
jgi:hypothetical protein